MSIGLSQWHFRHETIGKQLATICAFNPRKVFHARVDALGLTRGAELCFPSGKPHLA
jgi:hypothetical protein